MDQVNSSTRTNPLPTPRPRTLHYPAGSLGRPDAPGEDIPAPTHVELLFTGDDASAAEAYRSALVGSTRTIPRTASRRLRITCRRVTDPALSQDTVTGARHNEGYRLRVSAGEPTDSGDAAALLEYTGPRGLRNGVATLLQLPADATPLEIEDAPRVPLRGIIEGYYGPPWTGEERRETMRLAAAHKMNTYFYAPKDDPYHRERWRELYPPAEREDLADLARTASTLGLDFWYTIGPGLSMEYSSESDVRLLIAKLRDIASLGITSIGLLFDDIPASLQHDADRERFGSLPEAHALVANRVYREVREEHADARFVVCPTQYWGAGVEPYITELGALLDPRIEVFWTGPEICSRELTLRDAAILDRTLARPPVYWDNYPVNDLEMRHQLHLGPYRNRDPHLYRASAGVVANGAERAQATRIPLLTIADYLWNSEAYDPEASWQYAIRTVVGETDAEAFTQFADCNRYSALYPTDAPRLAAELERFWFLRGTGREAESCGVLRAAVGRLQEAVALFDRGMENERLEAEIAEWISGFRAGVALLDAVAQELVKPEPDRRRLAAQVAAYRKEPAYVFADVLYSVEEAFGEEAD